MLDQPDVDGGELWPDGRVLINSAAHGLQLFDAASGTMAEFELDIGGLPMNTYTVDHRGRLWINTGDALQLLDDARKPLQQFMPANGFSGKYMTTSLTDREGNLWFSTENGVNRVREPRLATIALPPGLTGPPGVVAGDDGAVWVINFHHANAYKVPTFIADRHGRRHDTDIHRVSASHRQPDGTVWFAGDGGLRRVHEGKTTRFALPSGLADRTVQAMTIGPDGVLWISVLGKGIHALKDGVWSAGGGYPELAMPTAISLSTDRAGRTWFGYPDNRIAMLEKGVIREFGEKDGLGVGNTLAIVEGRDRMWIGGDRGLAWFDGKRFLPLGERGRGAFYGVSGIVERQDGELWLHDTSGLARMEAAAIATAAGARLPDVVAERFDHLDGHQGMPAQIRPLPSLIQATDGRLWYATSNSVGHIDPAAIRRNPRPPTVLIGAIRTDERVYPAQPGLVLPARTSRLEIEFTATALSMPERVRFRYRLAGQDSGWRDSGGARQAVYTNLGPGAYIFEVSAADEDGVWSPRPARLALSIQAAFTQTWWFKLACAVVALAAAWLLHRWRLALVAAGLHKDLRVRLLERERIARTLHDTFLQSVQALIMRMHVMMHKLPGDSGMRAEIEGVLARAESVMDEGRDRVRQLREPAMPEGRLAQALAEAGRELALSSNVDFAVHDNGIPPELPPDVEDELFTIGREALSNAFRHAGATEVALRLDYRAGVLRLAVADNGRGIPREILARGARAGHWGLPGMRERAQLAGGSLDIDSTPDGTTVHVTVPITAIANARAADRA
ncbi:ATP-binding protein [Massilia sp. METH4]|uniref:sensor histidine kinase n=1 Tax=Massilia sp. METH4 TaxID=3123041 RepID=UPI0030D2478D